MGELRSQTVKLQVSLEQETLAKVKTSSRKKKKKKFDKVKKRPMKKKTNKRIPLTALDNNVEKRRSLELYQSRKRRVS